MAVKVLATLILAVSAIKNIQGLSFSGCYDDQMFVYADGVQYAASPSNTWNQPIYANIPDNTKIIALKGCNVGRSGIGQTSGYVKGSLSDGTATGSSWKCKSSMSELYYDLSWTTANFDDSSWPYASTGQGTMCNNCACSSQPGSPIWGDSTFNTAFVYCRKSINPCSSNPCQNGGACNKINPQTFSCTCAAGYQGTQCNIVVDPCSSSPCLNGGVCTKTSATTFTCACSAGWEGATCNNVADPCGSKPCANGGVCTKTSGTTFTCACPAGYTGVTCKSVIDPCDSDPCQNGASCFSSKSVPATFTCVCAAGFTGATCNKVSSPCDGNPCENGGSCKPTFTCTCVNGYTGNTCSQAPVVDPCASSPCKNGGACSVSGKTFTCTCSAGFTGANCNSAVVVDPCASSPCQNGVCSASGKTFSCTCDAGFTGTQCDSAIATGACTSSPCLHGGTCIPNGANDFDCNCVADWDDGDTCAEYQDPCTSSPCFHGGKCNRLSAFTFTCSCPAAYIGPFCEITAGTDPCSNTPCQHGGTCKTISKALGTYTCTCANLYEGTMCEKLICITNPTTDCDLVGTNYGKYAYCSDCGSWAVCKAKKRKTRSCKNRAPNLFFSRATRNCTATKSSCTGLPV